VYDGGPSYSYISDYVAGRSRVPITFHFEGKEDVVTTLNPVTEIVNVPGQGTALKLGFTGGTISSVADSVHKSAFGPEAVSVPFTAKKGDKIIFDYTSAGDEDNYEVYGFLYDGITYRELMYGRGQNQGWV